MFNRPESVFRTPEEKQRAADEMVDLFKPDIDERHRTREAEIQRQRLAAAAAIQAARAAQARVKPELQSAIAGAQERLKAVQVELETAKHDVEVATFNELAASLRSGEIIDRNQNFLLRSAPKVIDDFIHEMTGLIEETARLITTTENPNRNFLGAWFRHGRSNSAAVNRKVEAIRRAIEAAERLKLDPAADVTAELAKMRAGIPDESLAAEAYRYVAPVFEKDSGPRWIAAKD